MTHFKIYTYILQLILLKPTIYRLYQSSYFIQYKWTAKDLHRFEKSMKDRHQSKQKKNHMEETETMHF
jgi:nitrate reductase gamma subunit